MSKIEIPFNQTLQSKTPDFFPLSSSKIEIFQINVGKLCNMTCDHCHVEAGPHRTELMDKATFEQCLGLIRESGVSTVDLTGGAPEMNPHLDWFIREVSQLNRRIIIRSNLTVLLIPKYAHFIDLFTECKVEIAASLPCYLEDNTDQQRGDKTFQRSIKVLQKLNEKGYGKKGTGLILNLVHNPVGAYLPGSQAGLEAAYKEKLKASFNIDFNHLFCITNMPIKRFAEFLFHSKKYDEYLTLLRENFNPSSVEHVMCRNTISVGYDGKLYDCDFNQMLDMPVGLNLPRHIIDFDWTQLNNRRIVVADHCFGCTAGAGSSCQGSLD